jgi:Pyruvate/2-oxoacid:ferredoxin oxidoreductase delta subunit
VTACPFAARALVEGKARLVNLCFGCGLCEAVCPEAAIAMHKRSRAGLEA